MKTEIECEPKIIVFRMSSESIRTTLYVWAPGVPSYEIPERIGNKNASVYKLADDIVGGSVLRQGEIFALYVSGCFAPPMYVVCADNETEAYEWFITECEHLVKIEEADLPDYKEVVRGDYEEWRCDFNDNGTPCDTEGVCMAPLEIVAVYC